MYVLHFAEATCKDLTGPTEMSQCYLDCTTWRSDFNLLDLVCCTHAHMHTCTHAHMHTCKAYITCTMSHKRFACCKKMRDQSVVIAHDAPT